jgi:septal ring factor EnvC (AmiA/AmiB activator)
MKRALIIVSCMVIMASSMVAQNDVEKVRKMRENTLKEIEYANKLLEETRGQTKASLQEVNIINQKLKKRQQYITGLETETELVGQTVVEYQGEIDIVQAEIKRLKDLYADMVVRNYKNRWNNYYVMYFLASDNMNQLYQRLRFVRIYYSYIENQKLKLDELKADLDVKSNELLEVKKQKDILIRTTKREYSVIQEESAKKIKLVDSLKKKQAEIEREIRDKERTAKKLDNEITKIIEAEKRKSGKGSIKANLTPADQIISSDFEKNRGKLPWPTKEGIISGKYGEHEHPDFKEVKIRNDGIYISTSKGEPVRSIFKGVVSRVFSIPGENYTVIIKHGNYYTLYHNLVDVTVKAGQHVDTKEVMGKVYTDNETKESTLYFQIWKETERNDPELWLAN